MLGAIIGLLPSIGGLLGGGGGSQDEGGGVASGGLGGGSGLFGSVVGIVEGILGPINCWGSSWKPQDGKDFVNQTLPVYQSTFQNLFQTATEQDEQMVNDTIRAYYATHERERAYIQKEASGCTRTTLQAMCAALDVGLTDILKVFKNQMSERGYEVKINSSTYKFQHWNASDIHTLPIKTVSITKKGLLSFAGAPKLMGGNMLGAATILLMGGAAYKYYQDNQTPAKGGKKWKPIK